MIFVSLLGLTSEPAIFPLLRLDSVAQPFNDLREARDLGARAAVRQTRRGASFRLRRGTQGLLTKLLGKVQPLAARSAEALALALSVAAHARSRDPAWVPALGWRRQEAVGAAEMHGDLGRDRTDRGLGRRRRRPPAGRRVRAHLNRD